MKTVLVRIPDGKERWFNTLFDQLKVEHRILSTKDREDIALARLIDEAMEEEGEATEEEVMLVLNSNGGKV